MRANNVNSRGRSHQNGAVLPIAIVLLLLAGLLTLLALNVGIFEQRSVGNDLREKAVKEVAEAGLAQGFEYLMRQHRDTMLDDSVGWQKCLATDETFPCGAISDDPVDADGDPDTAGTVTRRETMYRLVAGGHTITGLSSDLTQYMLPLQSGSKMSTAVGGASISYGVAPVLCFVERPAGPDDPSKPPMPITCGDGTGPRSTDIRAVTFVSVAKIPGESASATLVQTLGEYPKIGDLLGLPPLTTAGSAGVTGALQVVTNPNAAGAGVPVSVWTRVDVQKTGTTNTCYADEFFRYTKNNVTPTIYDGTVRCDECQCDVNGAPTTLSFDNSGNTQAEGIDILDVDAGTNSATGYHAGNHVGANYNVRADAASYPTCEFPPDLFAFIFQADTWEDTNEDCFAETKRAKVTYVNKAGVSGLVDPDEAWLYKNADKIINAPDATLLNPGQEGFAATLLTAPTAVSTSGIIWCHSGCDIASGVQVGTPSAPVILVLDGPVTLHGTVYGLVYIREPAQSSPTTAVVLDPSTGSDSAGGCPSNCMLQMNAGAVVYGAMVVQGQMKANGTAALVFDATVLGALEGLNLPIPATLPGAWNDQRSY